MQLLHKVISITSWPKHYITSGEDIQRSSSLQMCQLAIKTHCIVENSIRQLAESN